MAKVLGICSGGGGETRGHLGERGLSVLMRAPESRSQKAHEGQPFLNIGSTSISRSASSLQLGKPVEKLCPLNRSAVQDSNSFSSSSSSVERSGKHVPVSGAGVRKENRSGCFTAPVQTASHTTHTAPPTTHPSRPSHQVKMPFKHSVRKPAETRGQEPSQDLKAMTTLATRHVTQTLTHQTSSKPTQRSGRLQKGKLLPLYPVSVSGPSIEQCQGILSESRSVSSTCSRTLQRRRWIMMQLRSGQLDLDPRSGQLDPRSRKLDPKLEQLDPRSGQGDLSKRPLPTFAGSQCEQHAGIEDLTGDVEALKETDGDFQAELAHVEKDLLISEELGEDGETTMTFSREVSFLSRDSTLHVHPSGPPTLDPGLVGLQLPDFTTPRPPQASIDTHITQGMVDTEADASKERPKSSGIKSADEAVIPQSANNSVLINSAADGCVQTADHLTRGECGPVLVKEGPVLATEEIPIPAKGSHARAGDSESKFSGIKVPTANSASSNSPVDDPHDQNSK